VAIQQVDFADCKVHFFTAIGYNTTVKGIIHKVLLLLCCCCLHWRKRKETLLRDNQYAFRFVYCIRTI